VSRLILYLDWIPSEAFATFAGKAEIFVDRSDWRRQVNFLLVQAKQETPCSILTLTILTFLHEANSLLPTIVMTTVQHLEDFCCAFCYAPAKKPLLCGQCHKRRYCSKDCQRSDWKEASHKHFCRKAGEIGIDYDVRPTEDGRGLGVFARRSFKKNEMIMAERPIIKVNDGTFHNNSLPNWDQVPPSARPAIRALLPIDGSIQQKLETNGMACTDISDHVQETGLFVTMSRVNHSCLGNTQHTYTENRRAKILVASRDIEEGEEITFSYQPSKKTDERKAILLVNYGFVCQCAACTTNPEIEAMLMRSMELDKEIMQCGSMGQIDLAIRKGKALLQIYDELNVSSWLYQRTYYDLFQVAIKKRKYLKVGLEYCTSGRPTKPLLPLPRTRITSLFCT
jgi:hypothetical protein